MKGIGSFRFVGLSGEEKIKHQELIDNFFIKNNQKETILNLFKIGSDTGERDIKILGGNEKDYNFYNKSILSNNLIEKLHEKIKEKKVDNLKVPLLSEEGGKELKKGFEKVMKDFIFHINLNSVSPIIDKEEFSKKRESYMRHINKFKREGFLFKEIKSFEEKVKKLHKKRWGDNRGEEFFNYLKYMNKKNLSKSFGLYKNKELVAYIQLIITGDTLHYYYSIFNDEFDGSGSVIINYAIKYFLESPNFRYFSFGRGSEEYKHRWNTGLVKNYELRGFLN